MSSEVPQGWQTATLGKVLARAEGGGTPPRDVEGYWNGDIPWASVKDIVKGNGSIPQETITAAGLANSTSRIVAAGTNIFAARMGVGAVTRYPMDVAINQDLMALTPAKGLDPDYLYHWLRSKKAAFAAVATGTTVKGIRKDLLLSFPLHLPPLDEQRRIAEVLRSVDDAIAAAQAVSNATQHAFASVRAELMEEARATSDEVVIADAIAKNRGQKLKKLQTSDYLEDGAFPIIDQGAAFVCGFTDDAAALWPYDLPVIVFGDHTRILKFVDVPFVIGADSTQCITPAAGIDARYMYYALQSLDLRGEGYARHFKLLKEKSMPMPTLPEQCEIAQQLCSLEASVTAADVATERLLEVKRALLSDLLSGRVRVHA